MTSFFDDGVEVLAGDGTFGDREAFTHCEWVHALSAHIQEQHRSRG